MPATYAKHWVTVSLLDLIDGREKLFTFVGLLSTCLLALLAGIGAISLAARNAEQYGSMAAFLDHVLAEQIPRLRSAAESGRNEGRDSILAFWRDLRGLLQREHNDWAYHSLKRAEDAMNDILSTWKKLGE